MLDWAPMPFLDTGFEVAWKKTDYKDLLYGRTDDRRHEYNVTVSYGDPKKFRVTGLVNYEIVEFNQAYRNGTPASGSSPNECRELRLEHEQHADQQAVRPHRRLDR